MTSGSQVSAARSSTGMGGSISMARAYSGWSQAWRRSRIAFRAGVSRPVRKEATFSPAARRRMRMTTARSWIVSGRSPIPASAAMAKVGNSCTW